MKKIKKPLAWIGTVLFGMLIFAGGFSAVFWLLATLNVLPVEKWQNFKREKLKLGTGLSVVLGVALFFVGGLLLPDTGNTDDKQLDNSSSIVDTVETTEQTETTTTEPEAPTTEEPTTTTTAATEPTTEATTTTEEIIPENSTFSIHFINVGQADAALVECDGHYMLVDGGNVEDSNVMYSALKNSGVTALDIVVGTHAHEDHIGGLSGALSYASAELVLCPVTEYDSDAFNDFKERAGSLTVPSVGDTYDLGSADITILGVNGGSETNDTSIILMIEYGDTSFLFTGDAEREAEQAVLATGADLSCDVLKVGHHGSDTSTSYVWLNAIMPEYAVISVGEGNSYDHPTDAVLSRLRDADVKTFRTDLNGDIYVTSDGETVSITTDKTATDDEIFTPGFTPTEPPTTVPPATDPPAIEQTTGNYVANTNTYKFHETWCSSAKKIKDSNRWDYTGTRDELISMGYDPCKNCNP